MYPGGGREGRGSWRGSRLESRAHKIREGTKLRVARQRAQVRPLAPYDSAAAARSPDPPWPANPPAALPGNIGELPAPPPHLLTRMTGARRAALRPQKQTGGPGGACAVRATDARTSAVGPPSRSRPAEPDTAWVFTVPSRLRHRQPRSTGQGPGLGTAQPALAQAAQPHRHCTVERRLRLAASRTAGLTVRQSRGAGRQCLGKPGRV